MKVLLANLYFLFSLLIIGASPRIFKDRTSSFFATLRENRGLLTSHVEPHFGAGGHGGIGVRRMDSDASDRLPVT